MATPEQLEEFRKKAFISPNIGKHGKRKKTLEREELRSQVVKYFGERILSLLETIDIAIKNGDVTSAFKALEQIIGKPVQSVEGGDSNRPIIVKIEQEVAEKYGLNISSEDNS